MRITQIQTIVNGILSNDSRSNAGGLFVANAPVAVRLMCARLMRTFAWFIGAEANLWHFNSASILDGQLCLAEGPRTALRNSIDDRILVDGSSYPNGYQLEQPGAQVELSKRTFG